jgi:hypothetical protein
MGKDNKCLGCGQKFKQKDASVQCNICGLWSHKSCSGLTNDFFNSMAAQIKATGQAFWACRACSSYAAGMNHRLKEVGDQAKAALNKAEENEKETNKPKDKVEKNSEKVDRKKTQTELDKYEEMSLREEKRKNVVIHGLPEPGGEDGWTIMGEDRKKLNNMFTVLDINVTVKKEREG